jgi:chain length determinant protein tyrosine kinase EpsG
MRTLKRRPDLVASSTPNTVSELLGQHLLETGKLTEEDITRIVAVQRQSNARFGDVAVGLGLLTAAELQAALAQQYDYPYLQADDSSLDPILVAAHQPFGSITEPYRTLRSQLLLRWFRDGRHALAVSGCRSGEGASTLAANLAVVFAQLGERTLLIDANFRRPKQQALFGLSAASGLSNLLSGRCELADALADVPAFRNLTVLCAGPPPPNPQELLSRLNFSYLVETTPASFDVVIIDAPAILEFADAQMVAARVGGCLLSTHRNSSRVNDVQQAKKLLEPSGAHIIGAVIHD